MVRTESRVLSHKIERMEQQRRELQDEKRRLKDLASEVVTAMVSEGNQ